jgi:predicted RNase H-like HicB family nuclease
MRYAIVVKRQGDGFGATVAGLPGLVAVAPTKSQVREMAREAISFSTAAGSQQRGSLRERLRQTAKRQIRAETI